MDIDRRRFLQLMSASLALAGTRCTGPPPEEIVPYVHLPGDLRASEPLFYATAYVRGGYAHGVLVQTNMGRATKVEGNPAQPASVGGTDVFGQASVLELWDPERSQTVFRADAISTWESYASDVEARLARLDADHGAGFRVLTGTVTSPTLIAQLRGLTSRYREARWHVYAPLENGRAHAGAHLAFGRACDCVYRFGAVRTVVALDADFLSNGPAATRYARDFAARRKNPEPDRMSRLYALESTPGLTGAMADERLALVPQEIERAVWRVAAVLGVAPKTFDANAHTARWEAALADALRASRGSALVIAGDRLSAETHALVHRLNEEFGTPGATHVYIEPVAADATSGAQPFADLVRDMQGGAVDTLVMLGGNPAYDAPVESEFAAALERVAFSVHACLYRNETSRRATWHLPALHAYEQWSDACVYDGTVTIVQPAMRAIYGGRSSHEVLAQWLRDSARSGLDIVRRTWHDKPWRESLQRGLIDGSARAPVNVVVRSKLSPPTLEDAPLVALFAPDPSTYDGTYANNAWLQELPRPLTKLVWDNAALMSPATARALNCASGDVVSLGIEGRALDAPVWICPGHADGAVTLPLGYGRSAAGQVGNGVGFNAYRVYTTQARGAAVPVTLQHTATRHAFVSTQGHDRMLGRGIVRSAPLAQYLRNPNFANDEPRKRVPEASLYPPYEYPNYRWAMAIDLNACIGCSACTIACQAENNIPVVGKEQVAREREMHWIRVDRYYEGSDESPRTFFQPVPCMHCENAPCEEVCPVGATVHDSEGLNLQVYNRCVGTRFCSNNCPYKVRRFNFFQYSDWSNRQLASQRNPEVTVRQRGVMEKCTYCVQRITRGRIEAEKGVRRLRDGEVVTACEAVCPTNAIVFGDLNDPESRVSRIKRSPLNYTLLAELNTRPRTTYLARVVNPDPKLA